jgi:hypothetical protein
MNAELKIRYEGDDDDEVAIYELHRADGKVININDLFDDGVSDFRWIGEDHEFLNVGYSDWDSSEFTAIVNTDGEILRKGILEIDEYVREHALFVVRMSGFGMHDEALDYDMQSDDEKIAVINRFGDFVIGPEYDSIVYEPEENLFYAWYGYGSNEIEHKFTLDGKRVRD